MTRRAKLAVGTLALAGLLGVGYVVVRHLRAVQPTALPIARDTTYLTGPLDAAGRVDYAAELNGAAFPPAEENAAIPLIRVVGTDVLLGDLEQTRKRLGAPLDLPAKGLLVLQPDEPPFFLMIEDVETEEDREAFRAWVKRNEKALELREAAQCLDASEREVRLEGPPDGERGAGEDRIQINTGAGLPTTHSVGKPQRTHAAQ